METPEFNQSPETISQQKIFDSLDTICTKLQRPELKKHLLTAYAHGETPEAERVPASNIILTINNSETHQPEFTTKIYTHQGKEEECIREYAALKFFNDKHKEHGIKYPTVIYAHPTPGELPLLITSYEQGRLPNLEDPNQRQADLKRLLSYYVLTEKSQPELSDYPLLSQQSTDTYGGYINIISHKFLDKVDQSVPDSQVTHYYHEIDNRISALKTEIGDQLISQGETVISRQDEHPFQFLIQPDNTIVPLDWGDGGVQARFLGFADFVLHQQTQIPTEERFALIKQFASEQNLNSKEITHLRQCLTLVNLKWASILLRNSQPGYISKHPLTRNLVGLSHEQIRKEILDEIDGRLKLNFDFLTT